MAALLALLLSQEAPSVEALLFLARHAERRDCGCAPSTPGDPGRTVLAFLSNSYSQFSQDSFQGVNFGDVLRALLPAIVAAQRDDGLFYPDDPASNAWMALALSETFGMTGDKRYEAPARRAVEAIQGMPANDPEARFWQLIALRSAVVGGLLARSPEPPAAEVDDAPLDVAKRDQGFFFAPGHGRAGHIDWQKALRDRWRPRRIPEGCGKGSWERSVEKTAYLSAALDRYCWACKTFGRVGAEK